MRIIRIINQLVLGVMCFSSLVWAENQGNFVGGESAQAKEKWRPRSERVKEPEEKVISESKELTAEEILMQVGTMAVADEKAYTLGIDDVLEILVQRHPEVSGQYVINGEGKIQYEFVGDLSIAGLTKEKVRDLVVEQLSKYIVSPDVTVKIIGYNSKVVYVIGEVGRPGKIFMRGDTITVREALLGAGLPLLSAATKKTRLITPSADGKPAQKFINVEALLYEGDLRENLVMNPGDTLYIPATVLAKAMRAIQPVTQPLGEAAGTTRSVYPGL